MYGGGGGGGGGEGKAVIEHPGPTCGPKLYKVRGRGGGGAYTGNTIYPCKHCRAVMHDVIKTDTCSYNIIIILQTDLISHILITSWPART